MSVRTPMGVGSWERIIGGRRYWFNSTPFDVKVFRLTLEGGDLVHHWRDVPDTGGEYSPFDESTRPAVGEIAWSQHWDRRSSERHYWTTCRSCRDVVRLTHEQLLTAHGDRYGSLTCSASGTAATLKAAMVREASLNREESAVSASVGRWLTTCRGVDSITGDECHHPICDERRQAGVRWSLMGWR